MCTPSKKVGDDEYLFVVCTRCIEKVKLAKDEGGGWWHPFDNIGEFLREHNNCPQDAIILRWE